MFSEMAKEVLMLLSECTEEEKQGILEAALEKAHKGPADATLFNPQPTPPTP